MRNVQRLGDWPVDGVREAKGLKVTLKLVMVRWVTNGIVTAGGRSEVRKRFEEENHFSCR